MLPGLAARAQLQVDRLRTVVFFLLLPTDDLIRACLILLLLVPGLATAWDYEVLVDGEVDPSP